MNAEGAQFSILNKDIAVLPWGPEVIDITEAKNKMLNNYTMLWLIFFSSYLATTLFIFYS